MCLGLAPTKRGHYNRRSDRRCRAATNGSPQLTGREKAHTERPTCSWPSERDSKFPLALPLLDSFFP